MKESLFDYPDNGLSVEPHNRSGPYTNGMIDSKDIYTLVSELDDGSA